MAMLLVQAKAYNYITKSQSEYLWRQMSASGYRSQEPRELDFAAERPAFINDLIELHRQQLGYSDEEDTSQPLLQFAGGHYIVKIIGEDVFFHLLAALFDQLGAVFDKLHD